MSRIKYTALEILIQSLTKSEKRHFKLIIQQTKSSENSLFYQLYKHIEKKGYLQEEIILKIIPRLKKSQIPNLKNQIYIHILDALRSFYNNNSIELSLRSQIDNGKILYNKALYRQSLNILNKAKKKALYYNLFSIALEIVEFEKYIESQHITNSKKYRAQDLIKESQHIKRKVDNINKFQNLSLGLYDLYLTQGFAKNQEKFEFISTYFQEKKPKNYELPKMSFFEKLYLYQSFVWYNYMVQNFAQYYKYANYWVNLFEYNDWMIELRPTLYLKGLHNLLTSQYNVFLYSNYQNTLNKLKEFGDYPKIRMDKNLVNLKALYYYLHKIELFYWKGDFKSGVHFISDLEKILENNPHNWDTYRVLKFHYKVGSMYFGNDDYPNTIKHLNKIINFHQFPIHSELHAYAMILSTMAHYEMGNTALIEYLIKSIFRFLKLKENLQLVEIAILNFVKKIPSLTMSNYLENFTNFKQKLELLQQNKFEKRAFLYLDIISWLESKIQQKPIALIIQSKFKSKIRENVN